jgi:hypothetical protein
VTAAADKSFNATISPIALAAGGSYGVAPRDPIILTITNTSNQAQMGSANVTLPAGLKLTDATATSGTATATPNLTTNTVELRNLGLQPGGFVTASVSAQVECASNHSPYVWSFEVKQANDFNGTPGNDLAPDGDVTSTVTGHCGLSFTKQPKSEEKNVTITNKIYDIGTPHGDPVTVSVVDSEGSAVPWWSGTMAIAMGSNPGSATLGGTLTGSTINGSVTFAPTIGTSATGYTLAATAVATAGTPSAGISGSPVSDAFTIVDDATICLTAGSSCMVTASGPSHGNAVSTQATVTAGAVSGPNPIGGANDLVILQVGDPATNDFSCQGYDTITDVIAFNATLSDGVSPVSRAKTSQVTLFAQFVTKSASKYDACYRSSPGAAFTPKGGGPMVTTGLLPNCAAKNPVAPCVVSRAADKQKNVILTVLSPAGDPGLKW